MKNHPINKAILLFIVGLLCFPGNTFAVKNANPVSTQDVTLDQKDFLRSREETKGEKLSFFEKIAAKSIFKKTKGTKGTEKNKKMAIAALQLGIVSILALLAGAIATISLLSLLFLPAGILAIVLGAKAKKRAKHEPEKYGGLGMAKAGFILGIVSIGIVVLSFLFLLVILAIFLL